jgi:hypothetical protein
MECPRAVNASCAYRTANNKATATGTTQRLPLVKAACGAATEEAFSEIIVIALLVTSQVCILMSVCAAEETELADTRNSSRIIYILK